MPKNNLNFDAKRENMRALANALGVTEDEAGIKLQFEVTLRYSRQIQDSEPFVKELFDLLSRTVESVTINESDVSGISEIDIQSETTSTLYVSIINNAFTLSLEPTVSTSVLVKPKNQPLFLLLTACYASAAILKLAVPDIPLSCKLPMHFDLSEIIDPNLLTKKIDLQTSYMAGAGAIGNALLWSFRHLDVHGQLHVCDDDKTSAGNLNRQLFFNENDIGSFKANLLTQKASLYMPNLKLIPRTILLQNLEEAGEGFWLSRLISAVDSRRARRTLQDQFPKEVFDASTTDISDVVVHYHKQPIDTACMSCVYSEDDAERSHELNIAESLGVDVGDVKKGRISDEIAKIIIKRFPDAGIDATDITGGAYDSLYKALCGQGRLPDIEGGQTLAPFCFVSVLAGVMLAIEIVNRLAPNTRPIEYNYWKISAWHPPFSKMKKTLTRKPQCPTCGSNIVRALIRERWSN